MALLNWQMDIPETNFFADNGSGGMPTGGAAPNRIHSQVWRRQKTIGGITTTNFGGPLDPSGSWGPEIQYPYFSMFGVELLTSTPWVQTTSGVNPPGLLPPAADTKVRGYKFVSANGNQQNPYMAKVYHYIPVDLSGGNRGTPALASLAGDYTSWHWYDPAYTVPGGGNGTQMHQYKNGVVFNANAVGGGNSDPSFWVQTYGNGPTKLQFRHANDWNRESGGICAYNRSQNLPLGQPFRIRTHATMTGVMVYLGTVTFPGGVFTLTEVALTSSEVPFSHMPDQGFYNGEKYWGGAPALIFGVGNYNFSTGAQTSWCLSAATTPPGGVIPTVPQDTAGGGGGGGGGGGTTGFVAASTPSSVSASSSIIVPKPAGAATGDVELAAIRWGGSPTLATPTGWTLRQNASQTVAGGSDYATTILAETALKAYWRLGESSGTSAADSKGTFTGTYNGGYTLNTASLLNNTSNGSVSLNGSSGYVSVPYSATINPSLFTYEAWVKFNNNSPTVVENIFSARTGNLGIAIYREPTGKLLQAEVGTGSTASYVTSSFTYDGGVLYHIAVTYDGTTLRFYRNGVLDVATAVTFSPNTSVQLSIGRYSSAIQFLNGTIDEAAVYNAALNATALLGHYNVGVSAPGGPGGTDNLSVFERVLDASDSTLTGHTFNFSSAPDVARQVAGAWRGVTGVEAVGTPGSSASGTSLTVPSVTAAGAGEILVALASANLSSTAHTFSGAPVERADGQGFGLADELLSAAGASGTRTDTLSQSDAAMSMSFALSNNPAALAPTVGTPTVTSLTTAASTLTVNKPAGLVPGKDFMYMLVHGDGALADFTLPAGWLELHKTFPNDATSVRQVSAASMTTVLWKRASVNDPTSWGLTFTTVGKHQATIVPVIYAKTVVAVESQLNAAGLTVALPDANASEANTAVLRLATLDNGTTVTPGSISEIVDSKTGNTTTDRSIWVGKTAQGPVGAVGSATVTDSNPNALTADQTVGLTIVTSRLADNTSRLVSDKSSLTFTKAAGAVVDPGSQALNITDAVTGGTNPAFTAAATSVGGWLLASPASGSAPNIVTVAVDSSRLTPGTYTGSVTVTPAEPSSEAIVVPVTFTVASNATAVLASTPTSLSFSGLVGSSPASQTLSITNTSTGGTPTFTVSDDATWLTVSPGSGTAPATLTVSVSTAGLPVGSYSGTITITGANIVTVGVTLTLTDTTPVVSVAPTSLAFAAPKGSTPATQTLSVTNTGGTQGSLGYSVASDRTWLTVTGGDGVVPDTLTVAVSSATLAVGAVSGTLTFTPAQPGAPVITVPVSFNVTPAAVANTASPASLTFWGAPSRTLVKQITLGGTTSFTTSDNASWLTVTPASGTAPATLTATVNTTGLSSGTYTATITAGAVSVPVKLVVAPAGTWINHPDVQNFVRGRLTSLKGVAVTYPAGTYTDAEITREHLDKFYAPDSTGALVPGFVKID
jgi:hypothetical protein